MGWMWFSSGSTAEEGTEASKDASSSSVALTDEQRIRIFGKPGPAVASTKPTREQQADSELDEFIKSFAASDTGSAAPQVIDPDTPPENTKVAEQLRNIPDRVRADGSLDISPDAVYPRTMSCRAQFDQAFYCQSLGGKFNDVYRYGHLRSCSEQWGAFWFCMRTRTLPEKEKEEQIRDYYKARDERRKKEGGSSEDIWELRKTAVPRAFWKDPNADADESAVVKE
ncbi:Hypothetical predicted protein [Lecanosticta acicola]|uniref:Early meiotic induction protein 1 n=1 Tax=Lecanosticta acicola TaxID=111012 RepID=A0AAI9E891_9PEZI|nr:Hypothetical predicted protein [Lecanosticta acicola]